MERSEIRHALGRAVGPWPRRWLLVITLLAGLAVAVALTTDMPPAGRTFAALSNPVQSVMSIAVPLIGILLIHDRSRTARLAPTLVAATLLAVAIGVFGVLVAAGALAVAGPGATEDPWRHAGTVAVGGVLVQIVPVLFGTGLGLLLRSSVIAFLATIVLPIGLLLVLSGAETLQAWLTPYGAVRNLLSGEMSPLRWAQWLVVLLIWGVTPNVVGAAISSRAKV
jgi:hypothetical protein